MVSYSVSTPTSTLKAVFHCSSNFELRAPQIWVKLIWKLISTCVLAVINAIKCKNGENCKNCKNYNIKLDEISHFTPKSNVADLKLANKCNGLAGPETILEKIDWIYIFDSYSYILRFWKSEFEFCKGTQSLEIYQFCNAITHTHTQTHTHIHTHKHTRTHAHRQRFLGDNLK